MGCLILTGCSDDKTDTAEACAATRAFIDWIGDNPAPSGTVSDGAVWAAEFRNAELVWLAAIPKDVADDARASSTEALTSPAVAEREEAEAADARVQEWALDECGLDGL